MARILVVDDDPDILLILTRVLESQGHEVFSADHAMKATDYLNSTLFDLMITDAQMPRLSGFDLVHSLKNNKRYARMAIAMLTGLREKKDIEKGIRAGIDDYIIKPIDPLVLLDKVNQLFLKKPPMHRMDFVVPENANWGEAVLQINARVKVVTESGLTLHSSSPMKIDAKIQIDSEVFRKMSLQTPHLVVLSCEKKSDELFELKTGFVGINEAFQRKIRAWIHSQSDTQTHSDTLLNQKKRSA